MAPARLSLSGLALLASVLTTSWAFAEDNCPVGSSEKKENGFTWCEPTVCETDIQCGTGMVCKPIPLCVEVGSLDGSAGEAGARLMVRQRCGENKSCPQNTTCSEKGRCLTPAQADRAGLMTAPSASPPSAPGDAKKSACGCSVVGAPEASETMVGALASLAAIVLVRRRRASRS